MSKRKSLSAPNMTNRTAEANKVLVRKKVSRVKTLANPNKPVDFTNQSVRDNVVKKLDPGPSISKLPYRYHGQPCLMPPTQFLHQKNPL